MAIIKPSRKFIGSDLKGGGGTKYIKDDVRTLSFSAKENKDGLYVYILPPYKADANGDGVWYKAIKIRDNFGDKFKEKYAISPHYPDPVDHFERNFKLHFPEEAKVVDEIDANGQSRKRYPNYGRKTHRVLYNVGIGDKLSDGAYVLDLPSYMGASQIMDWQESKDARGKERPLINDPDASCAVFVKLKSGGSGNPWQIQVDPNERIKLPAELAESQHLYNLDNVLDYKTPDELIEKLKGMYSPEEFELCMQGYDSGTTSFSVGVQKPRVVEGSAVVKPVTPKVTAPSVAPGLQVSEEDDKIPMEFVDDDAPVEAPPKRTKLDAAGAAAFLRQK